MITLRLRLLLWWPLAGFACVSSLALAGSTVSAAENSVTSTQISVSRELLLGETQSLEKLKTEVQRQKQQREINLALLQEKTVTETTLEKARLAMESAQVNVQSVKLDLANEQQKVSTLQAQIARLQQQISSVNSTQDSKKSQPQDVQKKISRIQSLLALTQQQVSVLSTRLDLLQEKSGLAASWWQSVEAVFQKQQKILHQESLEDMQHRLQIREQEVQKKSSELHQALLSLQGNDADTSARRELLDRQLEALSESLNVLRTRVKLQSMKSELDSLVPGSPVKQSTNRLQTALDTLKQVSDQLQPMASLTAGKLDVLHQQWALVQKQYALKNISRDSFDKEKKILTDLIARYSTLLKTLKGFSSRIHQQLDAVGKAHDNSVQQSLTARQTLPNDLHTWKLLFAEFAVLPKKLRQLFASIANQLVTGWRQADTGRHLLFIVAMLILTGMVVFLGRLPKVRDWHQPEDLRYSAKFRLLTLALLRASRFIIPPGAILLIAGWLFELDSTEFRVLFLFVSVFFVLQMVIILSSLIFILPLVQATRRQPRLHHMIVWGAGFSAFLTLLVGLGDIGIFSGQLRDVLDRLFMLLLLLSVYFFMRLRTVLISGLTAETKSRFWVHLTILASLFIPLTALAAALVGLAGYINLAWFVAAQLALFLAVVIAWIVIHDLLRDQLMNWKFRMEASSSQRDTPASRLIVALERVIGLLLFPVALWSLAWIYGWGTGTAADNFLREWLNYPLFHMGNLTITFINIISSLFLFVLFLYLSSMARHMTYLWFYQNIDDRGLRNSLSIFTQYTVLLIGSLIALNAMGINLTSLTIFAGALGVGIGFGLQNIANNLISGLILLAERPVRIEDWVSIGKNQGIISRIGLRSLVLTTWDNQDVIIPNSQLISNPVTNWTLSDTLIRTVFEVGVRYQDDPHQAADVILEAVSMVPEVSLERKPVVFLVEFSSSSVNFRVDFFSNIKNQRSRLTIKSKVMFAIWDALKEADIGIPFPQQDIYIKELPGTNAAESPMSQQPEREQGNRGGLQEKR